MKVAKVTARWAGSKVRFDVHTGSGHSTVADEPPILGADEGMRPTEMLLGALAACTGINAVLLLKKFRQPLEAIEIEATGDQEPEWPRRFTKIKLTFAMRWNGDHDREQVDKAIDLACNRYCPVDATLTHGAEIEVHQTHAAGRV